VMIRLWYTVTDCL